MLSLDQSAAKLHPNSADQSEEGIFSAKCFTKDQKSNITEFFYVLRKIHRRLISEGYLVSNGRILPPSRKAVNMQRDYEHE